MNGPQEHRRGWTRRACLALAAGAFRARPARAADRPRRVACLEWTAAETLLALGVAPAAIGDVGGYREWVVEPTLPPAVLDLGSRLEPNRELLLAIEPDLIVLSDGYGLDAAAFERFAPVVELSPFVGAGSAFDHAAGQARRLAERLGHPEAAIALLAEVEGVIAEARRDLSAAGLGPVCAVSLFEERTARIYGDAGLIGDTMKRLVVTLLTGSAAATLMALKSDYVAEIFVWQSGSLVQNGNAAAIGLTWHLGAAAGLAVLLVRPLTVLGLDDRMAGALGVSPRQIRLLAVTMGVVLSASVTAVVGVIAFIGLAAPALARLAGARTFRAQVAAAPALGALVLLLTDRAVAAWFGATEIPAGAATAILGAPLLFLLLPLVRGALPTAQGAAEPLPRASRRALGWWILAVLVLVLVAIGFGRELGGWGWLSPDEWSEVLPLRAPRVLAAASAGVLLAVAGVLLQRVTGNPMASPEFLGVSGGATLGVVVLLFATSGLDRLSILAAAALGAAAATALILALSGRGGQAPERVLLLGISVATLASSLAALMLASGDPRIQWLQAWLAGSTYRAAWPDALVALAGAAAVLLLAPLTLRWLAILPLGVSVSGALGLPLRRARVLLVSFAACATALATLTIGPLSFVGLIAPHLARMLGLRRPGEQITAAALIGAAMLVAADWLGRTIIYPWQVPAGLLAAALGAPLFAWLMRAGGGNAAR